MKSFVVATTLGLGVLSSTVVWSYGSQIELGPINVPAGQEAKIDVASLPIYPGVTYNFDCKLEALKEDSHLRIKASASSVPIWMADCIGSAQFEVTCPVVKEKESRFGFKRITKSDGTIALRNLDFNQVFTATCIASVSM
ncbi:MAG: hypothetical protein HYX60_07825 [Legionella longbeachae]|nr:hypothetical protein [Legionella longbeachae]